jgi:hypothetical protein
MLKRERFFEQVECKKLRMTDIKNSVPASQKKTNQLILFREIIPVYSDSHIKHMYKIFRQNADLLNIKSGDTYTKHCILMVYTNSMPVSFEKLYGVSTNISGCFIIRELLYL